MPHVSVHGDNLVIKILLYFHLSSANLQIFCWTQLFLRAQRGQSVAILFMFGGSSRKRLNNI